MSDAASPGRRTARPTNLTWGYSSWIPALGAVALAGGIVWALLAAAERDRTVALALAVFGLVALLCGLRMRHRLTADDDGLTIRSVLGSRRIDWAQITSVTTAAHRRLGSTSRLLEIDLDDDSLLVFGGIELGADCEQVASVLAVRHAAAGR